MFVLYKTTNQHLVQYKTISQVEENPLSKTFIISMDKNIRKVILKLIILNPIKTKEVNYVEQKF